MGIEINEMAGADSTSSQSEGSTQDDFVYNVYVEEGESVTLTGDWDNSLDRDGQTGNGDGQYTVMSGLPSFGSFSLSSTDGAMSWSFTYDDLVANGGTTQQVVFTVQGQHDYGGIDTDTVTVNITCFVTGTRISTPQGDRKVEDLRIGDSVTTADGREVAIRWIGRQHIDNNVFLPQTQCPVVISAGALGQGLPNRDLYLSADHAMVLDGLMITAGALVNDSTIRFVHRADMPRAFTYFHIETEAHDVVLANGAASETYVDERDRANFDNYAEYVALYGDARTITEIDMPRISTARLVPAVIQHRLATPIAA
ncbi:Hint domain-containing protein [Psychromarinibacter halotolerans]|uniref:Hint domain-containing protein n=1 Tax=Psychromarinibacter halotolerans TaxID=1775175 RepID=A0ABV7GSG2_9RHOB|nr:Hint domain-containing protein [Psychromarinibacter halotolerans]MDF0597495.1 Hint domain-containing protein [Psychromarinibacter halotolerans]